MIGGFLAHRVEAIYTGSYALAVQQLKNEGLIVKSGVSVYTTDDAKTALENPFVEIIAKCVGMLHSVGLISGVSQILLNLEF